MRKEQVHLTEAYDNMVPKEYREKAFSRLSKSGIRSQPNNLGLEHIRDHKSREGLQFAGDYQ